jgi:NADH-quinone oxidoreductase subunit J
MEFFIFFIYLFVLLAVFSSFLVISVNNPVHSVIALIAVFFNVSGLFFLFGFEYLALVLIVVYVGAIAVLFLFVVMMLNIKSVGVPFDLRGLVSFLFFLFMSLLLFFSSSEDFWLPLDGNYTNWSVVLSKPSDMEVIGQLLFTYGFLFVLVAGLVLLVAMVGSIVLTMVHSGFVRRQQVYIQVSRNVASAISLKKVN